MAGLLKAQTQMLAAPVQSLSTRTPFTGEESQDFDNWLKSFEERAFAAGWTAEQKPSQLKAYLKKTALQIFRLLSEDERLTDDKTIKALIKRFKPINIEELRGIDKRCSRMNQSSSLE